MSVVKSATFVQLHLGASFAVRRADVDDCIPFEPYMYIT